MHKRIENKKRRRNSLLLRGLLISFCFIFLNILGAFFTYKNNSISLSLCIILPFVYGVFYILIKKLRKKTKPKIKAFVYIPLFYTLIGFIWFFFCYAVNVYNGDDQSNYDRETLIQKDFVKQFFLVNPNLLNISVIIEEIETINQKLGKNTEEISIGKLQTNYMIRFSIIFIFQMLIIYLVETKIYPYFKPESHKYRRTKIVYEKLELDNPNMNSN